MADDLFESLATEEPDRDDEELDEGMLSISSATQAESVSPNDSDLQTTLKLLFPLVEDVEIRKIANLIMLGRIFPDNFTDKIYIITTTIAKRHRHDPTFDVILTQQAIEQLCQIGLDGKGRVDAVIVSGNSKEQAEQESRVGAL